MEYNIQLLDKEKWQGHQVIFSDFADNCYKIEIVNNKNDFSVIIKKVPLKERKIIKYTNILYDSGHKDVKVWGIIENNQLIAGIETGVEQWSKNPRLYISKLWVNDEYKRKGLASTLMDTVKKYAIDNQYRAIYLETWSCNEHAISFYISQGFKLIGFDTCPFSNEDIEKFNVPLKFGYFIS